MSRDVRDFFERNAELYRDKEAGMASFHRVTAAKIETALEGNVLCLGGIWAEASPRLDPRITVTVADLSINMLRQIRAPLVRVVCDAQQPGLRDSTFDHVVLALMLHHVTDRTFASAQTGVRRVLSQVRPLLRTGGRLWISDFCTAPVVYGLQRIVAPATRGLLALFNEPLVIMHSERFYRDVLEESGWKQIEIERVASDSARWWGLIRPIIAAPWFRVPRLSYPLRPTLIQAVAASSSCP